MLELSAELRYALDRLRREWHMTELSFFGSAIRSDFAEASDVDVLVDFAPGQTPGFAFMSLCRELAAILGRRVDVFTRAGVEQASDSSIKESILHTARELYASRLTTLS